MSGKKTKKEDKYHKALVDIINYCEAHKDLMEDSFSYETICSIGDAARDAIGLAKRYDMGGNISAYTPEIG